MLALILSDVFKLVPNVNFTSGAILLNDSFTWFLASLCFIFPLNYCSYYESFLKFIFLLLIKFSFMLFISMVVKGIVCKKNVAHRRMTSKIDKPRLLLLGGALEYQRVANHLSSFDTLLQQVFTQSNSLLIIFIYLIG